MRRTDPNDARERAATTRRRLMSAATASFEIDPGRMIRTESERAGERERERERAQSNKFSTIYNFQKGISVSGISLSNNLD